MSSSSSMILPLAVVGKIAGGRLVPLALEGTGLIVALPRASCNCETDWLKSRRRLSQASGIGSMMAQPRSRSARRCRRRLKSVITSCVSRAEASARDSAAAALWDSSATCSRLCSQPLREQRHAHQHHPGGGRRHGGVAEAEVADHVHRQKHDGEGDQKHRLADRADTGKQVRDDASSPQCDAMPLASRTVQAPSASSLSTGTALSTTASTPKGAVIGRAAAPPARRTWSTVAPSQGSAMTSTGTPPHPAPAPVPRQAPCRPRRDARGPAPRHPWSCGASWTCAASISPVLFASLTSLKARSNIPQARSH